MAANSTARVTRTKGRRVFPLFQHQRGYWCKKVRGRLCYFGQVAQDPRGDAALQLWLDQKDDLLAGRTPRRTRDGLTLRELCNRFLTAWERKRDAGDIRAKTFDEYHAVCKTVLDAFGKTRSVTDLAADDFDALRARLAKRLGVHGLSREVQQVRTIFKYAYDAGLIDAPVRFGPTFKRPSRRVIRAHRQQGGPRMFERAQLWRMIYAADQPLKAMILLGVNAGFGNNDCGRLPKRALDLERGWVDFPRPKTAVERRCPLWPETVEALRQVLATTSGRGHSIHDDLVFTTRFGRPWIKEGSDDAIAKEFRKLLKRLDAEAERAAQSGCARAPAPIYRRGLGFYALRHTFETIAGESRDQVAVNHIMGHVDSTMAGVYRERISDERLVAVVNAVRCWLFPRPTVG